MVPEIEVYSVDEAFLDLRGINNQNLSKLGEKISLKVRKGTGIPISVGISQTKTLAKVAASIAKRAPVSKGYFLLSGSDNITEALKHCPVGDIWGIGRKLSSFLAGNGIYTAFDFVNAPGEWIRTRLTITGFNTWRELRGESCISFEEMPGDKKQICTSRTFPVELSSIDDIYKAMSYFVSNGGEKLRRQRSVCNEIIIFLLTNVYKKTGSEHYRSIIVQTESPTDSTIELMKRVPPALEKIFREGTLYKKGGVILTGISKKSETAGTLFNSYDTARHDSLMECIDEINVKYGRGSIVPAAQGAKRFKTASTHLSKRYTTDWKDIITVKV
jgi:DNA polymerase V